MSTDRPPANQISPDNGNGMVQPRMIEIPHSTFVQMNPGQPKSFISPYQQADHPLEEKKYVYKYEEPKKEKKTDQQADSQHQEAKYVYKYVEPKREKVPKPPKTCKQRCGECWRGFWDCIWEKACQCECECCCCTVSAG